MQLVPIIGYLVIYWELDVIGPLRSVSTTKKNIHNALWSTKSTATDYYRGHLFIEHNLKCCCVWFWLWHRATLWSFKLPKSICTTFFLFFFFPFLPQPSTDRMQFYYWNCLLMIPNYPVEHSGEGQFQASNLCCNHRGNHTYNNVVAVYLQRHKQEARRSKTVVRGKMFQEWFWRERL